MQPSDCPAFEYDGHPNRPHLHGKLKKILIELRSGMLLQAELAQDTRPSHRDMFSDLTPPTCPYYAGHYRGEAYRCLRHYEVMVRGDPRVGAPPQAVLSRMSQFAGRIRSGLDALDQLHAPGSAALPVQKLMSAVAFVSNAFVHFLEIHPYANGNGHAARLLTVVVLGRYGYWPSGFTVEPRPPDPPYTACILAHRGGNQAPLVTWLLRFINGGGIQTP